MHQTFASELEVAGLPPVPRLLQPITGWVLQPLLILDRFRPGLLAEVTPARSRKRQAIYAALASDALDHPKPYARLLGAPPNWHGAIWPALLGEALVTSDPQAIVAEALGSVPDGYLTLLAKAGSRPLGKDAYRRLHAIFADPAQRRRRQLLSECEVLNDKRLDIVELLPIEALRQAVLFVCRDADDARMIAFLVELATRHGRSRVEIAKQISDMGPKTSLFGLACALTRSFELDADELGLPKLPERSFLLSSSALNVAGRDLDNCLGSFPITWATSMGEVVYAVLEDHRLILQLHRTSAGWLLSAVHRPGNVPVSGRDLKLACRVAEEAGMAVLASLQRSEGARLVGALLDGVGTQIAPRLE